MLLVTPTPKRLPKKPTIPNPKSPLKRLFPLSISSILLSFQKRSLSGCQNTSCGTTPLKSSLGSQRLCTPKSTSLFFIKKKEGTLCPVQDYQYLNSITVKNEYPLPLISNLIDQLKDASIFTKLDLRWGYNNVCIREGDQWKAAFKTKRGLYEPKVMFFGLCNSPATFQAMMNSLFHDLIGM